MTRRALLSMLAAAAADPEGLLWTPGKKLISIPRPRVPTQQWLRVDMQLDQHEGPFHPQILEKYVAPALALLEQDCANWIIKGAAVLENPKSELWMNSVRLRNGVPARIIIAYDLNRTDPRFICRVDCMFLGLDR